ncbi:MULTISPECIES: HAMP domain-containing sensor histidine kinase [unclassified Arthrobacter]|uniref:HAMP domain-containing sensor histidine kinase n=1 Tax=unclassified Arthrobacter TaxID=235627 RepID=UPI001E3BA414|nr:MULTISPECIES: HAMP domain-containing sensor histidine kinase [unclassified Arthrobacter]MCC9144389.1 HAMP domain-containing histidine kinase [Arthrobacter sp. zg-Y919]MDK1275615.1 HAMP domain-containing sensor histidine kinase [Arthrobacter sp. zg.Y919]WIB03016.1 HAMP domain-containing sensor histidine kinase [Arthrobacter sp. zg-Y919]
MSGKARHAAGGTAELRSHPLRTKLILATLALLTATCAALGLFSHVAMSRYLTGVLDDSLERAAGRAGFSPGQAGEQNQASGTGRAQDPAGADNGTGAKGNGTQYGRRPGSFSVVVEDGLPRRSSLVLEDGSAESLTAADLELLAAADPGSSPGNIDLSSGRYRVDAFASPPGTAEGMFVTGLSTGPRDRTLASLDITMVVLSLAGLLVTGFTGTVIIRRSLRPLDKLAAVATSVSKLPLASGEVEIPVRVPEAAARPGSEVGTVGSALNGMIDHVTNALRARQASETKVRQFVADASHELRTPLTAIRGYTELVLLSEHVSPPGRAALERVDSESRRMSALVEDLLLLARLDEGQRGEPAEVDLTELIIESVSDAQVSAPEDQWTLTLPEEPVTVSAVDSELRQILINLLSNAHRHTPPGTRVDVGLQSGSAWVTLTVTDDGPGIDPDFIDSLFSRFSKADFARTRGSGSSTGLGLAIVSALVTANRGTVDVESKPGRTCFTVVLPLAGTR